MAAGLKWFDLVVGVHVHLVIIPGNPNPVPMPHLFIGMVYDPIGLMISAALGAAPVLVNGLPAATAATGVLGLTHCPTPPGVAFAPNDIPTNHGTVVSGSQTVSLCGLSAARGGSMVSGCSYPVNTPNSTALASPGGPPVEIGGPEGVDAAAAILAGIHTAWFSEKMHAVLRIKPRSRLSKLICFFTGHPVDVVTGELCTDAEDFALPGPLPLPFERNYYSRDPIESAPGVLGPGWRHPLEACVDETKHRAGKWMLEVRLPDGRLCQLDPLEEGQSSWNAQDRFTLARDAGGYRLTFWDGTSSRFEPVRGAAVTHPLVRIEDRCGNTIAVSYSDGRLFEAVDSVGRRLRFLIKGDRLVSIRVLQRRGGGDAWQLLCRYEYEEGFLVRVLDPAGHPLRYEYENGLMVKETNRNGLSFYFEWDGKDAEAYCVRTWGDGGIYARRLTYHKYGFASVVEHGRGGQAMYRGNGDGCVEREIDAGGVERRYEWSDAFQKTAEIDALGNRTEWGYDERGNCIRELDALGNETRWRYNPLNLPVRRVDPTGAAWRWEYDHRGKLRKEVDPLGGVTLFQHDARGLLTRIEAPLGRVTVLEYDDDGNCVAITDPGGAVTRYAHDDLGRMIRAIDARGVQVDITRDACGRVVRVERSDGSFRRMKRDLEGNIVETTDERGRTWRYRYGGMNELVEQIDPEGGSVRLEYDEEEELTAIVNELGEVYSLVRDAGGRIKEETGFDGRTISYIRDRRGLVTRVTTATKKWIRLERDALGRVVRMQMPGRVPPANGRIPAPVVPEVDVVDYGYDVRGDVVRARNKTAEVILERDALGRVTVERIGPVSVERAYNAAGEVEIRRTSLGHEAHFSYDRRGDLDGYSFGHDGRFANFAPEVLGVGEAGLRAPYKARLQRDEVGAELRRFLPGDAASGWALDRYGRPKAHAFVAKGMRTDRGYGWTSEEELGSLTSLFFGETAYTHDGRGYLIGWANEEGENHRGVDAVGNVYRTADLSERRYGEGGRLLEAEGVRFEHDEDGQLVARVLPDGRRWVYSWDALGQLIEVVRPDGVRVEFGYDAFGRRLLKEVGGRRTAYLWDGDTLVHEEREGAALVTWVFAPGGISPLGKEEGGARYGVIADHIGAPLALVDEEGELRWLGEVDPWGKVWVQVEETDCPWRFPGQYQDGETGLLYNRFRFYDPGLGRFLSQDPIGPAGGINLYGWVGDPLVEIDALGLSKKCGVGPHSEVGGHHIHAKAAFLGHPLYDARAALAMSAEYMRRHRIIHVRVTGAQMKLFLELGASKRANTLAEHSRIAVEALVAVGASRAHAEELVEMSVENLLAQGVMNPLRIPWVDL